MQVPVCLWLSAYYKTPNEWKVKTNLSLLGLN